MADKDIERRLKIAKKTRGTDRTSATKFLGSVDGVYAVITDENFTQASLVLKRLTSLLADLTVHDAEIQSLLPDSELDADVDTSNEYKDNLKVAIETLEFRLQQFSVSKTAEISRAQPAQATASVDPKRVGPKLPKTSLLNFDGDPLKWESFWDDFESSVDSRSEITTSDKFKLLRQVLKGDARRVVDGYTLTNANYAQVKADLKERYGDEQIVKFAHFEKLLGLQPANHNLAELRRVHDECETHIRSLVALGLTEDMFGQVFVPILLSKFPKFVKMELFRRNGSSRWTLASLRSLLKDEIRARDMSEKTDTASSAGNKGGSQSRSGGKTFSGSTFLVQGDTTSGRNGSKTGGRQPCGYCGGNHSSWKCQRFPDFDSRNKTLGNRCKSCLQAGHFIKSCPTRKPCFYCQRDTHHSSLCLQQFRNPSSSSQSRAGTQAKPGTTFSGTGVTGSQRQPIQDTGYRSPGSVAETQNVVTFDPNAPSFYPVSPENSTIATAVLKNRGNALIKLGCGIVLGPQGPLRAQFFFDDGSTLSFASSNFLRQLQINPISMHTAAVGRFGDKGRQSGQYPVYKLVVQLANGTRKSILVNEIASISPPVHVVPIDVDRNPFVRGSSMAQPIVSKPTLVEIDILIGLDQYYDFIGPECTRSADGIVFHESVLGLVASGFLKGPRISHAFENQHMQLLILESQDSTDSADHGVGFDMRKFWEIEESGIQTKRALPEDDLAQNHFDTNVKQVDGRYQVKWPYRFENPDLADTYGIALNRLRGLLRRGLQNPAIIAEYQKTFADQIARGIIEVAPGQPQGLVYYVPHHVVIKPQKVTTKFRIVYDASAKPSKDSLSLNDSLLRGPVIMSDLVGSILRFRLSKFALVSDVEKAFHMVGLAPEDRDVTRFLWIRDLSKPLASDNLICYRFARVPFGTVASSFLLAATIVHHLRRNDSLNSRLMLENCYVDNILVGKPSLDEALSYYKEAKHLLSTASMNLREWFCNSHEFMNRIPRVDRGESSTTSVLGLTWDIDADTLACSLGKSGPAPARTKREVLSALASLFDPCGFFVPVTVACRLLMQGLWKDGYNWDDPLSQSLLTQWEAIQASLMSVPLHKIPRYLGLDKPFRDLQLHIFADASSKAYAAVAYLRAESAQGVSVHLLCAKARIAPIKPVTIPRLELMAVVIACHLSEFVETQLKLSISARFVWSDSKCALCWVIRSAKKPAFVANRVKEIQDFADREFRYVPTDANPADIASRGASADAIQKADIWWHGPPWLVQSDDQWPVTDILAPESQPEPKSLESDDPVNETNLVIQSVADNNILNLEDVSNLGRLLRVTAYVVRFVHKLRGRSTRGTRFVSAEEMRTAGNYWIRVTQSASFSHFHAQNTANKTTDAEKKLNVFKDSDGILRCRGRLDHADVPETARNPILIPNHHRFTFLIVKDVHEGLFHAGPKHTLAKLRETYWVPSGRTEVKGVIRECRLCRIVAGSPFLHPQTPDLPSIAIYSVEEAFQNIFAKQHGKSDLAEKLLDREDCIWDPTLTSTVLGNWLSGREPHVSEKVNINARVVANSAAIYAAILEYQMKKKSVFYYEMKKIVDNAKNPYSLRFHVYNTGKDLIFSCGVSYAQARRQPSIPFPGKNLYGLMLRKMAIKIHQKDGAADSAILRTMLTDFDHFAPYARSVKVGSDSQLRLLKKVECDGEIVPISGGRYRDLTNMIVNSEVPLESFMYVVLYDGTNEPVKRSYPEAERQAEFKQLKDILIVKARTRAPNTILFCSAFDHPRVRGNAEHARWVKEQFEGTGIRCLNWRDRAQGNPFLLPNGQIRRQYFDYSGFHLNKDGTKILWDAICDEIHGLGHFTYELWDKPHAIVRDIFDSDAGPSKRQRME